MGILIEGFKLLNVRIKHHKSVISLIEAVAIEDPKNSLTELHSMIDVEECVILQTCNFRELYIICKNSKDVTNLPTEYLIKRSGIKSE